MCRAPADPGSLGNPRASRASLCRRLQIQIQNMGVLPCLCAKHALMSVCSRLHIFHQYYEGSLRVPGFLEGSSGFPMVPQPGSPGNPQGTFKEPCFATLCIALLCFAMLCVALNCYVLLCIALLCFALHCYALLCFALLCFCFALH